MRSVHWMVIVALVVAAFLLGHALAQEQGGMQMPPWMQKGEQHKALAESVGEFDVAGEMWFAPGGPPQPYKATAKRELVLEGHYLKETFSGAWQGKPYTGWLFSGYDTFRKRYFNVWMDSMSPVASISFGGPDENGALVFDGEEPHPMTGKLTKSRSRIEYADDGKVTMSMYWVLPDGTEQIHMRLVYTRKTG